VSVRVAEGSSRRYWRGVLTYIVVLLSVQSAMGYGIDKFKELWGEGALEVVAYLIVAAGALVVMWVGLTVWARCSVADRAWIGLALLLYAVGTLNARYPQERLHYLGYGLMAILLYIGFARDRVGSTPDPGSGVASGGHRGFVAPALAAFVVGCLVGFADELLQILWPRRYFDWADVGMNVVAVGLGLLVAVPLWNALRR